MKVASVSAALAIFAAAVSAAPAFIPGICAGCGEIFLRGGTNPLHDFMVRTGLARIDDGMFIIGNEAVGRVVAFPADRAPMRAAGSEADNAAAAAADNAAGAADNAAGAADDAARAATPVSFPIRSIQASA
jgi:hypothetical protein